MAISFWKYLFFFLEIFTFLYNANEESDDVIGGSTKTVQQSIKNVSPEILEQCSSNMAPGQKKQNDTCCAIAMTTVILLVLF